MNMCRSRSSSTSLFIKGKLCTEVQNRVNFSSPIHLGARFKIGYQNIIFWSKVNQIRILTVKIGISLQWMANLQQEVHCIGFINDQFLAIVTSTRQI